jgi:type II secretory pathway pseudopilin PulG
MKKAFTLFELVAVTIVMVILGSLSLKYYLDHQKNKDIDKVVNEIVNATRIYALDSKVGYVNGNGGYCSDDGSFAKITAVRALKCAEMEGKPFNYNGDDDDINNFINIPMLITYTKIDVKNRNGDTIKEKTGCKILYKTDDDDKKILYVGIDCHYIPYERKRYMIENLLSTAFKENFPSLYEKTYFKGIPWESFDKGTKDDGKLIIELKE